MEEKILVPVLGESITEATISKWLKNEGDMVDADEPIVELETDKVNLEVPSPISGVLTKINSKDGSNVEVGAILGTVSANGEIQKESEDTKNVSKTLIDEKNVIELDKQKEIEDPKIFDDDKSIKEEPLILTKEIEDEKLLSKSEAEQFLSPAVRKMVSEKKIDINTVKGTGKDGRILKGDLINLMGTIPPPSERKISMVKKKKLK